MPAFSPTIGKFGDVTARGKPWTLWYKRHKKYVVIFSLASFMLAVSVAGWWLWQSREMPAPGGMLTEGMVGHPHRLNPLFSNQNDVDAELTPLIFRGLLRYNDKQELVPDLAEDVRQSEDGKRFDVVIGNHTWHDGSPVTARDVAYTIKLTQDAAYSGSWSGSFSEVAIEIKDDKHVSLQLKESYAPFKQNLTMGLLPEHLLSGKTATTLASDDFNLKPIGTGKLRFESLVTNAKTKQVEQLQFHLMDGFMESVRFHFYPSIETAMTDFKLGKIHALGTVYTPELSMLRDFDRHEQKQTLAGQSYGLFFNLDSPAVGDPNVRKALAYGLPKQQILHKLLNGHGEQIDNVFTRSQWAYSDHFEAYTYNTDEAHKIWSELENKPAKISLVVPDSALHKATADQIAQYWMKLGVKVSIEVKNGAEIGQLINEGKAYDVVLIGEKSRPDPDRYNNWHSTQVPPTGLNISRLKNKRVDKALEDARKLSSIEERKVKYATFQDYLSREIPVIWLYQPSYVYLWNNKLFGVKIGSLWNEQDRFATLEQWYVNQQRQQ